MEHLIKVCKVYCRVMVELSVKSSIANSALYVSVDYLDSFITLNIHIPDGKNESFYVNPFYWWEKESVFPCFRGMLNESDPVWSCFHSFNSEHDISLRNVFTWISDVCVDLNCRVGFTVYGLFRRAVRMFTKTRNFFKTVISYRNRCACSAAPMRL